MMTHIDPVCGMQVNQQNAAGRSGAPREDLLFLFRGLQETVRSGSGTLRPVGGARAVS